MSTESRKAWEKALENEWVKGAAWFVFTLVMVSIGIDIWYLIFRG